MLRYYFLIIIFAVYLEGCQVQVRYPSEFPSKNTITREEIYWFWGLVGEKKYEVYDFCLQGRVYEVIIYNTYLQSTYTVLSLGIYTPRTVRIVCSNRSEEP